MSLTTSSNKVVHSGNASATSFPFTFPVPEAADLVVIYADASGVETILSSATYSVTGLGGASGGSVAYPLSGSPIAVNTTLTIMRVVPLTQTTVLGNQGGYYPDVIEDRLDRIVMGLQQIQEQVDRVDLDPPGATPPTTAASWAALLALTDRPSTVSLQGVVSAGDGGGGEFDWYAGSTATAVTGMVGNPTSGEAGRYKRRISGALQPQWFGAKGDHVLAYRGVTIAASGTTLTVDSALFTSADVGKYIFIDRAGPQSANYVLITTITAVNAAGTQATLAGAATKALTAISTALRYGTNDYAALQAMFDYSFNNAAPWFVPPGPSGVWLTSATLAVRQPQVTYTNARGAQPPTWEIDNGATIKACATIAGPVIRYGAEDSDYSQFLREAIIEGGVIDCSFVATAGIEVPFFNVVNVSKVLVKNIKRKGIQLGSLTAPAASGGGRVSYSATGRDHSAITITAITKANPAVVTAPDHNLTNGDVVTMTVAGMTQLNARFFLIAGVTQSTFQLVNVNSGAYTTFTSGSAYYCMASMRVPQFISAATRANPCVLTFTAPHSFTNGMSIFVADLGGMTELDGVYPVANVTGTTLELSGVNSTAYTAYTSGGCAIEDVPLDDMQVGIYCENAPDVDTMWNQISGVRIGLRGDPADSTGYDGKHIGNHHYNYNEDGELLCAYDLGGDQTLIGVQVDVPFRFALRWRGPRNKTVGCRVNYAGGGILAAYQNYASIHRIESGCDVHSSGGGWKGDSGLEIRADVSGSGTYNWLGVSRLYVTSFPAPVLDVLDSIQLYHGKYVYTQYNGTTATGTIRAGIQFDGTNQAVGLYTANTFRGGPNSSGVLAMLYGITSAHSTLGIGYAAGAGGTVVQATDKSTGVTLSKVCGQITLNNASLAAATVVSFVLTNTAIAAGDVLLLNHVSGGTAGAYTLNARCGAGSATIDVRNATAGALGEAIVIGFTIIKAVTA